MSTTVTTFKHWMHHVHDDGVRVVHDASHLLHERAFWIVLAFVLLMAGLFALVVLLGQDFTMREYYRMPLPPMIH